MWRNIHLGVLSEEIETQKSTCNVTLIFKKRKHLEVQGVSQNVFHSQLISGIMGGFIFFFLE